VANKGLTAISCIKLVRYVVWEFRGIGSRGLKCALKTKNPRQLLAGRHFFSTTNLPFNQHPSPAIFFPLAHPRTVSSRAPVWTLPTGRDLLRPRGTPNDAPAFSYAFDFVSSGSTLVIPNGVRNLSAPFPIFSVFFHPQKVHYNALFTKISPKHAL
jgi:hypothetical protein